MTTPSHKTPEQVYELRKVFQDAYYSARLVPSSEAIDAGIAAVLAHTATKWHPVSEPVTEMGKRYWVRDKTGKYDDDIVCGFEIEGFYSNLFTHWSGPITAPPSEEEPSGKH